jgi:LysM repeat protein
MLPLLLSFSIVGASTSRSPEQETSEIAKNLHPIDDDEWKEIAGDRETEQYTVVEGDTLYDLSQRLFGDNKYWPKIWALNNGAITNPHYILPGESVAFAPGTGTSLPSLGVQTADNSDHQQNPDDEETDSVLDTGQGMRLRRGKSQEWRNLPKQAWEKLSIRLPAEVDPLGFDRRSRVQIKSNTTFEVPFSVSTKKIPPFGRIIGAETETNTISIQDIVFVSSKDCPTPVQVGQRYAISDVPYLLETKNKSKDKKDADARKGYSYAIAGIIKILDLKDGLYIGVIEEARIPFNRGATLIPLPPRIPGDRTPIAAPTAVTGTMLLDPYFSTSTSAQHKFVFVDRGSDDGVQIGMVFRAYQHSDLNNNLALTKSNMLINADLHVVQVSEKFSTVYIANSDSYIKSGDSVTLLTNISDILKADPRRRRIERTNGNGVDDLDMLDTGDALTDPERKELHQLEKYQGEVAPLTPTGAETAPPPPTAEPEALVPQAIEEPNGTGTAAPTMPPPPPDGAQEEIPPPEP